MTVADLLAELRQRGVELIPEGDHLRYRARRDVLTPELAAAMREHKAELKAWVIQRREEGRERNLTCCGQPDVASRRVIGGGLRSPFPDALPGLGPHRIGPFAPCAHCGTGTWAQYGDLHLCRSCAREVSAAERPPEQAE